MLELPVRSDPEVLEHLCTSGGSFHMRQEQWYPDEQTHTCPRCKGEGELEESFYLVCTHSASVCSCTDSEIHWYLHTSYLRVA